MPAGRTRLVADHRCHAWLPVCLAVLCCPLTSAAQSAAALPALRSTLDEYLRVQTQGLPGKVSYTIGPLDQHARLAACDAFEPFLPTGGKLWGRTTVAVRCLAPTHWTAYIAVHVRVEGSYLVAARQLTAGQTVTPADLLSRSGDLGALPSSVLTDPAQAIGKMLRSGIAAGQPLRADALLAPWAVQQGQSVKLRSTGAGFTVTNEGKALNSAAEGQIVQVRTPSGQVVSGVARSGGVVDVAH